MMRSKGTNIFIWIILGLLIVGLAGFSSGGFGSNIRTVGSVGDKEISVTRYANDLQQELRALSAQTGQPIPFTTAQAIGIDRNVLGRLVSARALDAETSRLGLSVGDTEVRDRILDIPSFGGLDGNFDRASYEDTLQRNGMTVRDFEAQVREDAARTILQGAIGAGLATSPTYEDTLFTYLGARRNFVWAPLGEDLLETPVAAPTDEELQGYYASNPTPFTSPEIKKLTYTVLMPDDLLDSVNVDDADLRETYEDRINEFVQPERRLVERLIFADQEAGEAAKARLDAAELTFEALVAERELDLADIDLGAVTVEELGDAGEGVFAIEDPAVVGPLGSDLGPALFRMNAVLLAQNTPFEEARDELSREIAGDRARRQIQAQAGDIDDLLAGGATLEEIAEETDMTVGTLDWHPEVDAPLAGYDAFRRAALSVSVGDFPELIELDDGGIAAIRLDEVVAPAVQPLDDVRPLAVELWQAAETQSQIRDIATGFIAQVEAGTDPATLGLTATIERDMTRDATIPDTPPALMTEVFEMEQGKAKIVEGDGQLILVHLLDILAPDETDDEIVGLRNAIVGGASQDMAQDLLEAFTRGIQTREDIRINQTALNAVHANFQ